MISYYRGEDENGASEAFSFHLFPFLLYFNCRLKVTINWQVNYTIKKQKLKQFDNILIILIDLN
jgi:hypothetical protein